MTAASVATAPQVGRAWGRGPFVAVLLVVSLVAGVAIGALAVRAAPAQAVVPDVGTSMIQPRVGPMAGPRTPAAAVDPMTNYARVVAGISVAESRHDFATKAHFESQLDAALTAETIGIVYQEHARLQQALDEALATGNGYAMFRITQELEGLCGPASVKASLSFC